MLHLLRARLSRREDAFTLVELMVVVLVISILSGISVPIFLKQQQESIHASVRSDVRNTVSSVGSWLASNPSTAVPTESQTGTTPVAGNVLDLVVSDSGTTVSVSPQEMRGSYRVLGVHPDSDFSFLFESTTGRFTDGTGTSVGGPGGGGSEEPPAEAEQSNRNLVNAPLRAGTLNDNGYRTASWGAFYASLDENTTRRDDSVSMMFTRRASNPTYPMYAAALNIGTMPDGNGNEQPIPVTSGETYTGSLWVRTNIAATGSLIVMEYNASGNALFGNNTPRSIPANTWVRLTHTQTMGDNTAGVGLEVQIMPATWGTESTGTELTWMQDVQFELGSTATEYFDGSMTSTDPTVRYEWEGEPYRSASVRVPVDD